MVSGYKVIKDQIVAILGGVSILKVVYGKEEKAIKAFPAACISAKEDTEEFNSVGSGGSNEAKYSLFIRLYFRTDEANDPDYEDILEGVADSVKQALRSNITLNNTCEYALPVSGTWMDGQKEAPVRVYQMVETAIVHMKRDTGELV